MLPSFCFVINDLHHTTTIETDDFTCVQISESDRSSPIILKPTTNSGTPSLSQSYTSSPFTTAKHQVTEFKVDAECTSNGPRAAPTCTWDVNLSYCDIGGTCNDADRSFRSGKFKAIGTGPTAYFLTGSGERSFEGVTGSIDSVFNLDTFELGTVRINLCSKNVNYGDNIILQNNYMDNRWLTGGRGASNAGVLTRDILSSTYESTTVPETYQWTVRSEVGDDGRRAAMDPKNGQCVKYGDKVHLQANVMDNRWLSGGRGEGNEGVVTRDRLGPDLEKSKPASYEWIIRASPGNGLRSDKDIRHGRCVEVGDIIHLQVNKLDNRWLSGSRGGGNAGVHTRDRFGATLNTDGDYERVKVGHTYEWIVLNEVGDGSRQKEEP